jgi:hypothetical protein
MAASGSGMVIPGRGVFVDTNPNAGDVLDAGVQRMPIALAMRRDPHRWEVRTRFVEGVRRGERD